MLGFASLITLGILFGFVFVILFLIANFGGYSIDLPVLIGLTVLFNILGWLISPFFMDLMYRWFYQTKQISLDELKQRSPKAAALMKKVAEKYSIPVPKLRLILDDNPTAFTFGSGAWNARMAISEGLFTYLDEDERTAVIAHEMGHIRRRDFIIMTLAATALEVLYEIYYSLIRRGSGKRDRDSRGPLEVVALVSYIFYWIGSYLILFLSRTREYGADHFSAEETGDPDALTRGLIKIAYGIIAKPDGAKAMHLLESTRALGIFDHKSARQVGGAFEAGKQDWNFMAKALAFDVVSPWAKILELQSTHPLTGKRIARLAAMAQEQGKHSSIDMGVVRNVPVDKERLYRGFFTGIIVHFLPWLLPLLLLLFGFVFRSPTGIAFAMTALGVGFLVRLLYQYSTSKEPEPITTLEALCDLYASPVRGKRISLEGTVIGRGMAGSRFHEDLMLQDATGLIYLNYESALGFFGNLFFAWNKVRRLIGNHVRLDGWFFRGLSHRVDLQGLTTQDGAAIKSHPILWGVIGSVFFIIMGLVVAAGAYAAQLPPNLVSFP